MNNNEFQVWKKEYMDELIEDYRQYLIVSAGYNQDELDIREIENFDDWAEWEYKKYGEDW